MRLLQQPRPPPTLFPAVATAAAATAAATTVAAAEVHLNYYCRRLRGDAPFLISHTVLPKQSVCLLHMHQQAGPYRRLAPREASPGAKVASLATSQRKQVAIRLLFSGKRLPGR